jgi:hypothetical protein
LPPGLLEGRAWLAQGSCASTEDAPTKELNTLRSNSNSQWMERTRDFWELLSQDGHPSDSSSFTATLWNPKFAAVHRVCKELRGKLDICTWSDLIRLEEILRTEVLLGVSLFFVWSIKKWSVHISETFGSED